MGRNGPSRQKKQAFLGHENDLARPTTECAVHADRDRTTQFVTREITKISRKFTEVTALSYSARAPLELVPRRDG